MQRPKQSRYLRSYAQAVIRLSYTKIFHFLLNDGTRSPVPANLNPADYGTRLRKAAMILAAGFSLTMKKAATLLALILSGSLIAYADHRAEDFLTWISDHLQTVSYTVTTPRAAYLENESTKMEFNGCNVKIVEDLTTQKSNIQTTVAFSLSDMQAGMIRVRPGRAFGNTRVTPYFLVQLPLVSAATNTTAFATSGESRTYTSASTSISIVFQDRDTANRHASAWRDAALGCGARESAPAR
jgi:hypothetical protein